MEIERRWSIMTGQRLTATTDGRYATVTNGDLPHRPGAAVVPESGRCGPPGPGDPAGAARIREDHCMALRIAGLPVPGPADLLDGARTVAGWTGEAVGVAAGLPERTVGLLDEVAALLTRVNGIAGRVEGLLDRVEGVADRADALIGRVDLVAGTAEGLLARVDRTAADATALITRVATTASDA